MDDPVFEKVSDCLKLYIKSSQKHLSNEKMEEFKSDIGSILESYSQLLNHHELACSAVKEVETLINNEDVDLETFSATEAFKIKLGELQKKNCKKQKNPSEELEKLLNKTVEDELEVVESESAIPLDPFTQKPVENPAKSTKCNHMFDYKTIKRMFSHLNKNSTLKCPHIGCVAVLKFDDIQQL